MFVANGGQESWLASLQHAPPKIQRLAELNAILAHQPWLLTAEKLKVYFAFFEYCFLNITFLNITF